MQGSGDAGRVMKRDVERAAVGAGAVTGSAGGGSGRAQAEARPAAEPPKARPAVPVAEAPPRPAGARTEERVRMSKRRATIAKRLVEAQQHRGDARRPSTKST